MEYENNSLTTVRDVENKNNKAESKWNMKAIL